MRTIAVINAKGGSGKTTTALCLAKGLAGRGRRVLMVDADSQANATMTLGEGQGGDLPTLGAVLLDQVDVEDAIRSTRIEGLDLLPADSQLADVALLLADAMGREYRLKNALEAIKDDYDVVIVDCPPQTSLVVVNVLAAVGELIVPVDAGIYSVAGLAQLQGTVDQVRKHLGNKRLAIAGLLLTRAHNNRATKDLAAQLREGYGDLVYRAMIPHSVRVEEAHARHQTVLEFAPKSPVSVAYTAFVDEVLSHGESKRNVPAKRADSADHAA